MKGIPAPLLFSVPSMMKHLELFSYLPLIHAFVVAAAGATAAYNLGFWLSDIFFLIQKWL